jgi:hypothetical protein
MEDTMCYERRSLTSDEHKKASTVERTSKEHDSKREEVVSSLLRDADKAGQKTHVAPAKEYTPAK